MANIYTTLQVFATPVISSKNKISIAISLIKIDDKDFGCDKQTTNYILPDEKSKFLNTVGDIFNSPDPPINISKEKYQEMIVNYTINLSLDSVDYDTLNKFYETNLSLGSFPQLFSTDVLQKGLEFLDSLKESNLSLYNASKDNTRGLDAAHYNETTENEIGGAYSNYETQKEFISKKQKSLFGEKSKTESKRPVVEMDGLPQSETDIFSDLPKQSTNNLKGVGGSRLIEPVPAPIYYPGDSFLSSENNSGIICSRDEIYRFRGHTKAGAVYLYAGMSSENIEPVKYSEDNSEEELINHQPISLVNDSAYVYVSQKADVDYLYHQGIAGGTYSKAIRPILKNAKYDSTETREGLSLVAMKADDVLIMSRVSGIRLVTGTDKSNSRGGRQYAKYGIDLIAGNDDSDLQPLVKGDNLVTYLKNLSDVVSKLRAVVFEHITSQTKFNAAVQKHSHYDPFSIFLATAATQGANPLAINGGKGLASDEAVFAGATALVEALALQVKAKKTAISRVNNDSNAFGKLGAYSILSEKNRTN